MCRYGSTCVERHMCTLMWLYFFFPSAPCFQVPFGHFFFFCFNSCYYGLDIFKKQTPCSLLTSFSLQGFIVLFGIYVAFWRQSLKYLSSTCPRQSQSWNPYRSHTHAETLAHGHTKQGLIATCSGLRNAVDADWTCQPGPHRRILGEMAKKGWRTEEGNEGKGKGSLRLRWWMMCKVTNVQQRRKVGFERWSRRLNLSFISPQNIYNWDTHTHTSRYIHRPAEMVKCCDKVLSSVHPNPPVSRSILTQHHVTTNVFVFLTRQCVCC